jgi:hypothetical protein
MNADLLASYQAQFSCGFAKAKDIFPDCIAQAQAKLSPSGVAAYLKGSNFLCKIGMGVEPVLIYLEIMPDIAQHIGEETLKLVADYAYQLARSPNKKSLLPFLNALSSVCRRIDTLEDLKRYLMILDGFVEKTQTVIHGHHSLYDSPGMSDPNIPID